MNWGWFLAENIRRERPQNLELIGLFGILKNEGIILKEVLFPL